VIFITGYLLFNPHLCKRKINDNMGFLSNLFGLGPKVDLKEMINNGAVIIDVRSPGEFSGGHAKGAINIPLDKLKNELPKIKNYKKPLVVCCASGMRSGNAKRILDQNGIEAVYNGGSWTSLV
jgi:phage shock protein E